MSLPLCKPCGNTRSGFKSKNYFWIASQGRLRSEDSRLRCEAALERLYLVAALALLYATTQGMSVQIAGLRQQVDPHWRRGISYLKIGLRWLQGVVHKGRQLRKPNCVAPERPTTLFCLESG
jgi:hypothetical protein